jgi:hypothetical protein|tara:strand:+ start:185 stop:292 length:108 start_codon:yes stop_codon:yes gene_type:complete
MPIQPKKATMDHDRVLTLAGTIALTLTTMQAMTHV